MNNIISLCPFKIGDVVKIGELLQYTISKIIGTSLYGFLKNDPDGEVERWITRNYRKKMVFTFAGKAQAFGIKKIS